MAYRTGAATIKAQSQNPYIVSVPVISSCGDLPISPWNPVWYLVLCPPPPLLPFGSQRSLGCFMCLALSVESQEYPRNITMVRLCLILELSKPVSVSLGLGASMALQSLSFEVAATCRNGKD